jgi:hypothetical protein
LGADHDHHQADRGRRHAGACACDGAVSGLVTNVTLINLPWISFAPQIAHRPLPP